MKHTIANLFEQNTDIRPGYEEFFEGVRTLTAGRALDDSLGEALKQYAQEFLRHCDLRDFQEFSDEKYGRIYLGRDAATGWEALIMCWKRGNRTSIHGHPQFAAYNFAAGRFLVETFEKGDDREAAAANSFEAEAGRSLWAVGRAGTFDNHIHRLTCLSDYGHSLHIYSDDALRGEVYEPLGSGAPESGSR